MAKTGAERQRAYREKHLDNGGRVDLLVSTECAKSISRLANHHRVTNREALERAISEAVGRAQEGMTAAEWKAFVKADKPVTAAVLKDFAPKK